MEFLTRKVRIAAGTHTLRARIILRAHIPAARVQTKLPLTARPVGYVHQRRYCHPPRKSESGTKHIGTLQGKGQFSGGAKQRDTNRSLDITEAEMLPSSKLTSHR